MTTPELVAITNASIFVKTANLAISDLLHAEIEFGSEGRKDVMRRLPQAHNVSEGLPHLSVLLVCAAL